MSISDDRFHRSVVHKYEIGITSRIAGNMFKTLISFILRMLKPTANVIMPPQAEKSAIIVGVVKGMRKDAEKNNVINHMN